MAKGTKKRSLRLQIGLFYVTLALINITFFSAMILENQTDLLLINFKYQSDDLAKTVLDQLGSLKINKRNEKDLKKIENTLKAFDLNSFSVFDSQGILWHQYPAKVKVGSTISKLLIRKSKDLNNRNSLFQSRYLIELNEKDFSLDMLLPLFSANTTTNKLYLLARLNIRSIQNRLLSIYYQVAGAVLWGIVFHFLFALFIFRLIFRRIEILKVVSNEMATGKLSARAVWQIKASKGEDELDVLGTSFNSMAESIQEKIETISSLNSQIQEELSIGKEVQELFLSPDKVIKRLEPALFYRPLREVSGDIYRYFSFRGGYSGVFFADASGHGVSAALITVITLLSLQEILATRHSSPQTIMTELNRILAVRLDTSYYATGIFLLFGDDNKLYATNAGHNTVYVLPKGSKEILEIKSNGPPLGLMEESSYSLEELPIKKGDKVFVYSDGLIETEDENGEQFGLDRLFSYLNETREKSNEVIHKKISTEFLDFARNYNDDVTFLVLEANR